MPPIPLGQRLRAWRHTHGYTMQGAEMRLGISDTIICHLERGYRLPSAEQTAKIEQLIGATDHDLFWINSRLNDENTRLAARVKDLEFQISTWQMATERSMTLAEQFLAEQSMEIAEQLLQDLASDG